MTGAARTAGNAGSCDAAGPDAGREGSAGEEPETEEEGAGDAQAFKRRKAAESSGAGSSAAAAAAESKSADTAAPSDGASRRSSSSRLGVAPTWLTSLLGFGGPAPADLAIPSGQAASGDGSREEPDRSAIACCSQPSSSRKRKLDCSGPASAAAAAASPCPLSAIGASSAHRAAGHSALPPGAVPPPRQLRVSNLDLLIAMMDLERYKDLLFAGEQTDRAAGEDAAGGCSAQAEHSAVHSIPERRHGAEPVERGHDEARLQPTASLGGAREEAQPG